MKKILKTLQMLLRNALRAVEKRYTLRDLIYIYIYFISFEKARDRQIAN